MKSKRKGFTLLEILTTSLIMGFLGIGAIFMVSASSRVLNSSVKQSFANSNIQTIMMAISEDVHAGEKLSTLTAGKDLVIQYRNELGTVQWYFDSNGSLFRKDKDGMVKRIAFFGANSVEVSGLFKPELIGLYWKVEIDIKMLLSDGNTFEVQNVRNIYFCKQEVLI